MKFFYMDQSRNKVICLNSSEAAPIMGITRITKDQARKLQKQGNVKFSFVALEELNIKTSNIRLSLNHTNRPMEVHQIAA